MVKAATSIKVDVDVIMSDTIEKLKSLVLELANQSNLELTSDQIEFTSTDWTSLVRTEGITEIEKTPYITLAELRRLARLRGYISSKPTVVQVPVYDNHRQVTVEWEIIWRDGVTDGAVGGASWRTVNPGFRNHPEAIASNRAEARCIRSALGITDCSTEEMGPEDEDLSGPSTDQQKIAIATILTRHNIEPSEFSELFGEDVASKMTDGTSVNLNGLTHELAVKILKTLNKRKTAKK